MLSNNALNILDFANKNKKARNWVLIRMKEVEYLHLSQKEFDSAIQELLDKNIIRKDRFNCEGIFQLLK